MDPHDVFCPDPACPATGQTGESNIKVHSRHPERYRCNVCTKTFSARKGTPLHRRRTPEATIVVVLTLVAYGCPIAAIEAAFGLQRRTVQGWVEAAGEHCQRIHEHLILKPSDLEHVQADEVRVKTQGGIVWMALAIMVSTRLWLGGATSPSRDKALIERLVALIRACALHQRPLLLVNGRPLHLLRKSFPQGVPLEGVHWTSGRAALDRLAKSSDRTGGRTLPTAARGGYRAAVSARELVASETLA